MISSPGSNTEKNGPLAASGEASLPSESEAGRLETASKPFPIIGICLLLAAITLLVFGQTVRFDFVNFDDDVNVYRNPVVTQGLSWKRIGWAFTHTQVGHWDPLTTISHMVDVQLFGPNAGGHHLTNVLLHTMSVIALFLVLRSLTGALWPSAFVAALFAIHPLHVESVAWVTERKDVLSGLFFVLTLGAYTRYARRPWSAARYGAVLLLFGAGLLSKSMLVTLPFVLLLVDYWPLNRVTRRALSRLIAEKVPLLALSLAVCAIQIFSAQAMLVPVDRLPLSGRLANALAAYGAYLVDLIYPVGLVVFYPHESTGLPGWKVAYSALVLGAISWAAFAACRRRPYLAVGWLWFLGMLVPVIGIIQSGDLAKADRYTYLPQIGLYLALTWLVVETSQAWPRRRLLLGGLAVTIIVGLMAVAALQTTHWKDSVALWRHALACTSENFTAHNNLGVALMDKGGSEEAIAQFRSALQLKASYLDANRNLAVLLAAEGKYAEAIPHYLYVLKDRPRDANICYELGNAWMRLQRPDDALVYYRKSLEIDPDFSLAHNNLANVLMEKKQVREAIRHWEKGLERLPEAVGARNNLAWVLATWPDPAVRDGGKALALAQKANELTGGTHVLILGTLAAAYAEVGNFSEAIRTVERAIDFARAQNLSERVTALQPQLEAYQAGKPFRDTAP